jgi:hypothetical protein
MRTNVQFQRFNKIAGGPEDYTMNEEGIKDLESVPNVGDHILFSGRKSGEKGLFKVRSRLFRYSFQEGDQEVGHAGEWTLYVNVVVEDEDPNRLNELIKE